MPLYKEASILSLQAMGLNTARILFTMGQHTACKQDRFNEWFSKQHPNLIVSVRTERDGEKLCPILPYKKLQTIVPELLNLMNQGYALLITEGINPQHCLRRGNLVKRTTTPVGHWKGKEIWQIELLEGPGTVRDLEHRNVTVYQVSTDRMHPQSVKTLPLPLSVLIGNLPIDFPSFQILEWSEYKYLVGEQPNHYIFWELRPWR